MVVKVLSIIGIIVGVLLSVAYLTVVERKYLSSIQRRRGPNVVGIFGLLQAIADGMKLFLKETILPSSANKGIFIWAPCVTFSLSLCSWAVMPIGQGMVFVDINIGILYIFAISSLSVYGIIMAGWASNSKYAFLGALRSTAQMISYEVSIGFTIVTMLVCVGSVNLTQIVESQEEIWYIIPMFPIFIVFLVSILAETNRHPFDLPEAEAELVSGYNVEYSGMGFALFFLGEYGSIILMSSLTVIMFLGGWNIPFINGSINVSIIGSIIGSIIFAIKTFIIVCFFIWARAAYPRYRYDQLMRLGWKVFLPVSMGWVILSSGIMLGFDGLVG